MTISIIISSTGLICDIIGVIILFFFGLPPDISKTGSIGLCVGTDEKEKGKAKKYNQVSGFALILIVVGFVLQLWSNFI